MMGASAGVYALMGAECVRIAVDLAAELRKLARLQRRQYLDSAALKERARIHNNIVHILAVAIGHVVAIGSQVVAAAGLFGDNNAYSIRQAPGGTSNASGSMPQVQLIDESVGYAAHVGGFLFGVTVRFFRVSLF
ncbi:hypothetical protein BDR26DRAFT_869407 [Obelidium mucronatum]|nr:hypothetical protein BDR26DRAFT_869407 [Obelidium mucronatum]